MVHALWADLSGGLRGYYARPDGVGPFPAVLVYQEAFGVNDYVQSEVRRLAAAGYAALAPDLFNGTTYVYGDPAVYERLASLADDEQLHYVHAALAFLDGRAEVRGERVGAIGFCMGGRLATLTALTFPERLGAAVSFYGGGLAPAQPRFFTPLAERLASLTVPLLLIYGADDAGIAADEHGRIVTALSGAQREYGLLVLKDAGHGFASRDRDAYVPRAADVAWDAALQWFERYLLT